MFPCLVLCQSFGTPIPLPPSVPHSPFSSSPFSHFFSQVLASVPNLVVCGQRVLWFLVFHLKGARKLGLISFLKKILLNQYYYFTPSKEPNQRYLHWKTEPKQSFWGLFGLVWLNRFGHLRKINWVFANTTLSKNQTLTSSHWTPNKINKNHWNTNYQNKIT